MGWSDAYDAHADLWRTTLVLGGFHEAGLARVPRSGQRRYWHCSERRSIWRETPAAKPWKGAGSGVLEVVEDHDGNTFRAVYTVRFRCAVYVLHCFQKKSRRGAQTPKPDVELVSQRLRLARQDYEERYGKIKRGT